MNKIRLWLFKRRYKRWSESIRTPASDMRSVSGVTDYMKGIAGMSPSAMEQRQRLQQMLMGQAQNHNPYRYEASMGLLGGVFGNTLGSLLGGGRQNDR